MPIQLTNQRLCGILPEFFDESDPRPARDQLHENYAHGGGVHPFKGFTLNSWRSLGRAYLSYPEDPPMMEVARGFLRNETVILFESNWVAIVQPNDDHLICRVD